MNKAFIIFFLTFSINASAQPVKLDSISSDILKLCQQIGPNKKIIGLGESTHGTREFTTIRAEIVKNLILNHNFKIFILEAEYAPCSKINNYILSGIGDPQILLKDVLLWPWINQDFLELISWLREYNLENPLEPVRFYGMDSQFSKLYATKDSITKYYPVESKLIFNVIENTNKPKAKINKLRALSDNIVQQSSEIDLRLHYYILCRINRIAHSKYRDLNARDQNMAYFIELLYKKYHMKSIIWAHNGHIWKRKPSIHDKTPAGFHIAKQFKDDYAVIGLDFKGGSFNAVSYDKIDFHKRRVFHLKPIENTLSMKINHHNKKLVVITCSTIRHKTYINSIGAIYVNSPKKGDAFTTRIKKNKEFDYIISIPKSSPTKLLSE